MEITNRHGLLHEIYFGENNKKTYTNIGEVSMFICNKLIIDFWQKYSQPQKQTNKLPGREIVGKLFTYLTQVQLEQIYQAEKVG